jgi:hypothetical protein
MAPLYFQVSAGHSKSGALTSIKNAREISEIARPSKVCPA